MLDALVGRVRVVADGGADPAHLVGGHRRTDPGATDEHAPLRGAAHERVPQAPSEVGVVIVRVGAVAAEVDQVVADVRRGQPPDQLVLEGGAGMVGRERDAHRAKDTAAG